MNEDLLSIADVLDDFREMGCAQTLRDLAAKLDAVEKEAQPAMDQDIVMCCKCGDRLYGDAEHGALQAQLAAANADLEKYRKEEAEIQAMLAEKETPRTKAQEEASQRRFQEVIASSKKTDAMTEVIMERDAALADDAGLRTRLAQLPTYSAMNLMGHADVLTTPRYVAVTDLKAAGISMEIMP